MDVNFPLNPPVNNLIQPTIYDRLDAMTFERIKIVNSQLNSRLQIQERIINKYKHDAMRVYHSQYRDLRREIKNIYKRKPNYVDEFEFSRSKQAESKDGGRTRLISETSDSSFCKRYYSHHFDIKDHSKTEKKDKKPAENDYFNARLRAFFFNVVTHTNDQGTPTALDNISRKDENDTSNDCSPAQRRDSIDTNQTYTYDSFSKNTHIEGNSELRFASRTSKGSDSVFTNYPRKTIRRELPIATRRKRSSSSHSREEHMHGSCLFMKDIKHTKRETWRHT